MRDQYDDQIYQALRGELNGSLTRLLQSIGSVFDLLTAQLYDAPWSRPEPAKKKCPESRLRTL
jgi:hypothetical protein